MKYLGPKIGVFLFDFFLNKVIDEHTGKYIQINSLFFVEISFFFILIYKYYSTINHVVHGYTVPIDHIVFNSAFYSWCKKYINTQIFGATEHRHELWYQFSHLTMNLKLVRMSLSSQYYSFPPLSWSFDLIFFISTKDRPSHSHPFNDHNSQLSLKMKDGMQPGKGGKWIAWNGKSLVARVLNK